MPEKKSSQASPEAQETIPNFILEKIAIDPEQGQKHLERWRRSKSQDLQEAAKANAEEIKEEIAPNGKMPDEQGNLLAWCGYPTDWTRTSPFFPMSKQELKIREYLHGVVITSAKWGKITYFGPKLSIYEEDYLVAILTVLSTGKNISVASVEDKPGLQQTTYTYDGPALPILRFTSENRSKNNPSKGAYNRLIRSLELMTIAGFKMELSKRTKKGDKAKRPRIIDMTQIIMHFRAYPDLNRICFTINPYFYETYMNGRVTPFDALQRARLDGVIARALYRFATSHRVEQDTRGKLKPVFDGHFVTLATAINMNMDQEQRQTRRQLKVAIQELVGKGVLLPTSGFVGKEIIQLYRQVETRIETKKLTT